MACYQYFVLIMEFSLQERARSDYRRLWPSCDRLWRFVSVCFRQLIHPRTIFMKSISTGIVVIASLLSTGAFAADLAPRPYTKAPPIADPGYNWTGFYVGINGGYSWGKASETALIGAPFPANAAATVKQNVDGGLFGGQIGYNWQVDRNWVLGL